ncbi:MAG: acyl carrier protein [Pirellulaceae bacterium]
MNVHERLELLFRNVFHDDDLRVSSDMTARDIPGWDSVAHVNLMFTIEQEFDIQFVGNELAEMKSIGELEEYLERRVSGGRLVR